MPNKNLGMDETNTFFSDLISRNIDEINLDIAQGESKKTVQARLALTRISSVLHDPTLEYTKMVTLIELACKGPAMDLIDGALATSVSALKDKQSGF
jgi:hypothetical protein